MTFENAAPTIFSRAESRSVTAEERDEEIADEIDQREVFDLLRGINDPEHPLTLEELNVIQEEQIDVCDEENRVRVQFTPTIPHCSMASLIGLCVRVRLLRCLPSRFKIDVEIYPGTHASRDELNKQLADKERVAAALENNNLLTVVNRCIGIPQG
eukprot:m.13050 g.13050  ORF g.13050 m.13050 type:complete len:156 (-) comp7409_c0_seq1:297-764(-)